MVTRVYLSMFHDVRQSLNLLPVRVYSCNTVFLLLFMCIGGVVDGRHGDGWCICTGGRGAGGSGSNWE